MTNLVLNIVLPAGLKLTNGAVLEQAANFQVVSELDPFYCSLEHLRMEGGIYLNKLSDMTLAFQIFSSSRLTQMLCYNQPKTPTTTEETDVGFRRWRLFMLARQKYTAMHAAKTLIENVFDLVGGRGTKTLGNFSVSRLMMQRDESVPQKLDSMSKQLQDLEIVLKSGGDIGIGGHARPAMAAKGLYNADSRPSGRLWATTGMGANMKTIPGLGSSGKPIKYGLPVLNNFAFRSPHLSTWIQGNLMNYGTMTVLPNASIGGVSLY